MKALVVPTPGKLELLDIPLPELGPYDALVRILACGICSTTDRAIIEGTQPYHRVYPAVLGHEAIGEVIELGEKVLHFRKGDLVTRPCAIWPGTQSCGMASGWGGFAEFGIVRDRRAAAADGDASLLTDYTALRQNVLSPGLTPFQGVTAIALAETASWLRQMPAVGGRTVCVSGTGIAGLSIGLWCKLAGARTVIVLGRREERLEKTRQICADFTVNVTREDWKDEVRSLCHGGADFYVEAVGHEDQINLGLNVLAPGGTVGIYGAAADQRYRLDWGNSSGDVSIRLAPALEHETFPWVADLITRNVVCTDSFLTHHWPITAFETAFQEIAAGKVLKGLLYFGS